MPTYEYECTKCGHAFEAAQKITDQPLNTCPKCKKQVRRLISGGIGLIFKGSGFYATDYRKKPEINTDTPSNTCPKLKQGCSGCQGNTG